MADIVGGPRDDETISRENLHEAIYLFAVAIIGSLLNVFVVVCILSCKDLRRMTSAFIVHGCTLDLIKCAYCIPFATSLLKNKPPEFCTALGGSYVIIVTASGFNIVAMVCCEAYTFSEHNIGGEGKGSLACVIFGLIMVYIGSIIIHLGPTIIGGEFNYNTPIGNCLFLYGTIKSYVVHSMWIVIMTLAMIGAVYYLVFFYRHVQAHSTHRLAALVRASIHISRGDSSDYNHIVRKIVRNSLSRARVLIAVTALFISFWYPLFILTLADPKFKHPSKIYKLLTFLAWSNSAVNPIVYILFDRNISIFRKCKRCWKCLHADDEEDSLMGPDRYVMPGGGARNRSLSRSRSRSLSRGTSRAGSVHRQAAGAAVSPGVFYERVGCRLCHEGHHHDNEHCNGGVGERLGRRSSMCELHEIPA